MNLYLCKSSILILCRIVNDMIILLFMLSIVFIRWSWIHFLKSWSWLAAIIFWICSNYWLLVFVSIYVISFLLDEVKAFLILVLILLLVWSSGRPDLSRFSLFLNRNLYGLLLCRRILFRLFFWLSHL